MAYYGWQLMILQAGETPALPLGFWQIFFASLTALPWVIALVHSIIVERRK